MRVLVIEDDGAIAAFIAKGLTEAGFTTDVVGDGEQGLHRPLQEPPYDALVVDLTLPSMDGLRVISMLRNRGVRSPVLILSARRSVDDRVRGLHTGGDDYLTKPFAMAELVARMQALVRRSTGAQSATRLVVGGLTMDPLTREVRRGDRLIDLRPREFALLEYRSCLLLLEKRRDDTGFRPPDTEPAAPGIGSRIHCLDRGRRAHSPGRTRIYRPPHIVGIRSLSK